MKWSPLVKKGSKMLKNVAVSLGVACDIESLGVGAIWIVHKATNLYLELGRVGLVSSSRIWKRLCNFILNKFV